MGIDRSNDGAFSTGTRVEVRSRFDAAWARGFEVADTQEAGYLVRRVSDGAVLPVPFGVDDLREEKSRRRNGWWY